MAILDDLRSWMRRQGSPVIVGIAVSLVIASVGLWLSHSPAILRFAFDSNWMTHPWSILTYPWVIDILASSFGIISLLFLVLMLNWFGAPTEREMGSTRFSGFMIVMTILPALILWMGAQAVQAPLIIIGPWLPLEAMIIVWCTRNQTATINLYGIIPLSGKWLGWITVAGVLFAYGAGNPLMGVLACGHLAVAWAFAADRLPIPYSGVTRKQRLESVQATRAQARYNEGYYDEVNRRSKEREEKERLRKLLEGSLDDDRK